MKKEKIWLVDFLDEGILTDEQARLVSDPLIYTSDTNAFLVFRPANMSIEFDSAEIAMVNKTDGSIIHHDMEMREPVDNQKEVFFDLTTEDVIKHWGNWEIQVIITHGGRNTTGPLVEMKIEKYLMDERVPRMELVSNWNTLVADATELLSTWETTVADIDSAELSRAQAELDRQAQEEARETAEAIREEAEDERETTFASYGPTLDAKADKSYVDAELEKKANKKQEGWITPALLNGFSGDLKYRKTQFGELQLVGTLISPVAINGQLTRIFDFTSDYRVGWGSNFHFIAPAYSYVAVEESKFVWSNYERALLVWTIRAGTHQINVTIPMEVS